MENEKGCLTYLLISITLILLGSFGFWLGYTYRVIGAIAFGWLLIGIGSAIWFIAFMKREDND